ncbi:MAG: hypothetical protein OHK0012_25260 [Synechococcales cyanobacterium]
MDDDLTLTPAAESTKRKGGRQRHLRTRELAPQVMALVAQGYSYRHIAQVVGLSKNTVNTIVKEAQQSSTLGIPWELLLDVHPCQWLDMAPFWQGVALQYGAVVGQQVGGELLGTGPIDPSLWANHGEALVNQGSLIISSGDQWAWVGVVTRHPLRILVLVRALPWTDAEQHSLEVLHQRLRRFVAHWGGQPSLEDSLRHQWQDASKQLTDQLRGPTTNLRMGILMLGQSHLTDRQHHYVSILNQEQQHFLEVIQSFQVQLQPLLGQRDPEPLGLQRWWMDFMTEYAHLQPRPLPWPERPLTTHRDYLTRLLAQALTVGQVTRDPVWVDEGLGPWLGWYLEGVYSPAQIQHMQGWIQGMQGDLIWDPRRRQLRLWVPDLAWKVSDRRLGVSEYGENALSGR